MSPFVVSLSNHERVAVDKLRPDAIREQRLAIADGLIINDAEPAQLLAAVDALHARYLDLTHHAKSL